MKILTANHHFEAPLIRLVAFALLVLAGNLCPAAAPISAIEGTVKDANGRPIKAADIRIEAKKQNFSKVVKSDAKGHYFSDGLASGATYRISLLVNGAVKASINNVQTK